MDQIKGIKHLLNASFPNKGIPIFSPVPLEQVIIGLKHDLDQIYKISHPFFGDKDLVSIAFEGLVVDAYPKIFNGFYDECVVKTFKKPNIPEYIKLNLPAKKTGLRGIGNLLNQFENLYAYESALIASVSLHVNDMTPSFSYGPNPLGEAGLVLSFDKDRTTLEARETELKKYAKLIFC